MLNTCYLSLNMDFKKYVCHCTREKSKMGAYVGRRNSAISPSVHGSDGRYGNQFCIGDNRDGDRKTVILKHRQWLLSDDPRAKLQRVNIKANLKDTILGCWCKPLPCHAETIAEVANQ
jgi:hypothetical protein